MNPEPISSKAELDEIILSAWIHELNDSWVDAQGHIHGSPTGRRFRALFIALDAERTLADTLAAALRAALNLSWPLEMEADIADALAQYKAARQQERKEQ